LKKQRGGNHLTRKTTAQKNPTLTDSNRWPKVRHCGQSEPEEPRPPEETGNRAKGSESRKMSRIFATFRTTPGKRHKPRDPDKLREKKNPAAQKESHDCQPENGKNAGLNLKRQQRRKQPPDQQSA
jgi:hypothetical protein